MPFGGGFDEIYNIFLVRALEEAGFEVSRADNINNAQNILKDIVKGIAQSDLVIADITDSNPNVYYELGLAHALGKPTILLAQEIDDVPFDLRSYRIIPYKTHFADIERARRQLAKLLAGFLSGETEFGNPASDFLGRPVETMQARRPEPVIEDGEPGLLDYMADMEEGFEHLGQSLGEFNARTHDLSETTVGVTSRLQSLQSSTDRASARQMRSLIMGLAEKLSNYGEFLESENEKYSNDLERTRTALESIVRAQNPHTSEEEAQLKSLLLALDTMEESTRSALSGISAMTESMRATPPVERTYARARDRAVRELQRFAVNIEQTIAMVSRTKGIGQSKLGISEEQLR